MENLIDIRCPFQQKGKDGRLYKCNRICVKVLPGSAGEIKCRSCRLTFEFEVDRQAKPMTGVRVQPHNLVS